jgi:hypothetical protein
LLPVTTEQKASSPSPVRSERHVRELRWDRGLIFGLIRLRSPTFIGVRINAAMQVAEVNGIWRTIIPTSENRKVDDSDYGQRDPPGSLQCSTALGGCVWSQCGRTRRGHGSVMGGRWLLCPIRSARQRPFIPAVRDALRLTDHDNATRMGVDDRVSESKDHVLRRLRLLSTSVGGVTGFPLRVMM